MSDRGKPAQIFTEGFNPSRAFQTVKNRLKKKGLNMIGACFYYHHLAMRRTGTNLARNTLLNGENPSIASR